MTTYELWDLESRNLIDWFDTLDELQAAVREMDLAVVGLAIRDDRGGTTWADPAAFAAALR
jgi:hypothetical protein